MATAEEIAASRALQEQEGIDRTPVVNGERTPDPKQSPINDRAEAPEDAHHGNDDDGRSRPEARERPKPIHMSPSDQARANIAKRFKRDEEGNVPFNGDPNDPEMMYGKVGRAPEEQVDPEPEPEPQQRQEQRQEQPAPKMHTIKVRGKEIQLTEAEVLERASKVEAADSYLEEGRQLLESARQINRDNRERDPADPHRPEGRTNTQDDVTDQSLSADPQHPEDELEGAIEEIRYGTDSKEAAKKLEQAINKRADKAADERQLQRLIANDDSKSSKALKAFIDANPELAKDPDTVRWMGNKLIDIQREELIKLGIDEAKLPKDNQAVAQWHRHWRVHGQPVSTQEQMLNEAKTRFEKWKGVSPRQQQPAPRKDAPRVEVNVDRNQRRELLPNHPTRSMAPPPQMNRQNDSAQPRDRSSIITWMRRGRGQIVA